MKYKQVNVKDVYRCEVTISHICIFILYELKFKPILIKAYKL